MREVKHPMHDFEISKRFHIYQEGCQQGVLGHYCPGEDCMENSECESNCCVKDGICDIRGEGGVNCSYVRIPFWGYVLIGSAILLIIILAIIVVWYVKRQHMDDVKMAEDEDLADTSFYSKKR